MFYKEGKFHELQQTRRLLVLKYSWEAKSLSQLAQLTGMHRGVMYRLFDDDPKLKEIAESRIAGKPSTLTPEELLDKVGDEEIAEIPNIKLIAASVLEPMQGKSEVITKGKLPPVPKAKPKMVLVEIDPTEQIKHNQPTHKSDLKDKIWKADQICNLVAEGSTTNQACNIIGVKPTTFGQWVNPASLEYVKEVSDLYTAAKNIFNQTMDEETQMLAKQSLRQLVEGRTIKLQTKIGRVDKEGKIKTTQIRETEKSFEPNFNAVAKVLTTREASIYGTPEERRLMANKGTSDNYELRSKTLEELDAEEKELIALLEGKKDENT